MTHEQTCGRTQQPDGANVFVLHPSGKYQAVTVADDQWEIREVGSNETVYHGAQRKSIMSLAFSGDGQQLIVAAEDGDVQIFDLDLDDLESTSKEEAAPVKLVKALKVPDQRSFIMTLGVISCCGNKAAEDASNNRVVVWDVPSGTMAEFQARRVTCLTSSPDGEQLAAAPRGGSVLVWNLRDGSRREVQSGRSAEVVGAASTQDGEYSATVSRDLSVRLWSVEGRECVAELSGHHQAGVCCVHMPLDHGAADTGAGAAVAVPAAAAQQQVINLDEQRANFVLAAVARVQQAELNVERGRVANDAWRTAMKVELGDMNPAERLAFSEADLRRRVQRVERVEERNRQLEAQIEQLQAQIRQLEDRQPGGGNRQPDGENQQPDGETQQ